VIGQIVYGLCSLTCILCAVLLYRQYRRNPTALLFWSMWCFICFSLNNILLFLDFVIFPTAINLANARSGLMLAGMTMLIVGLIHEKD